MPKNVTRTIRLDDDLDRAIQGRAREANVSVNFLVNRMIRKSIDWDIPSEKFGTAAVPSVLIRRLFDETDGEAPENLGRSMAREFFEPFGKYLFGDFTFETSILLFRRMSQYGGLLTFDTSHDSKKHIIILRHNAGQNVTSYYSGLLHGVYGDVLKMNPKVEGTRDICIAQIAVA
jgi:hypothetical protein